MILFLQIFKSLFRPKRKNWEAEILRECSPHTTCYISHVTYHVSHIMCHMSPVIYHMSHVTFHISHFIRHMLHIYIIFRGGVGGRATIGASIGWRVCHPLGTPRLVLIRTTIVVYCNSIDSVENLKSAKYFRFSKISNFYIFEICKFLSHTFAITP